MTNEFVYVTDVEPSAASQLGGLLVIVLILAIAAGVSYLIRLWKETK